MNKIPGSGLLLTLVIVLMLVGRVVRGTTVEDELFEAVRTNNVVGARAALTHKVDLKSAKAEAALAAALGGEDESLPVILLLLESGIDPNYILEGSPVWFRAISKRNISFLKILLNRKAVQLAATNKSDSVYAAAAVGWTAGIEMLIEHGAVPDLVADNGETALLRLSKIPLGDCWREAEYAEALGFLIRRGADPLRKNRSGLTAADLAFSSAATEVLKQVDTSHAYSARIDEIRQMSLDRQLWSAVNRHMTSRVRWAGKPPYPSVNLKKQIASLVKEGANPYQIFAADGARLPAMAQCLGASQLHAEADPEVLKILLSSAATQPNNGVSPLVYAARTPEMIPLLLSHGFPLDAMFPENALSPIRNDRTPLGNSRIGVLHAVAATGSPKSIEALIKAGAAVNALSEDGRTALHFALKSGNIPNAVALLDNKADPAIKGGDGKDAVDMTADLLAIGLLRRIDSQKRYSSLLDQFPPDPHSEFLGVWATTPVPNTTIGQFGLELRPDGSGSYMQREVGWRHQGDVLVVSTAWPVPTYSGLVPRRASFVFEIFGQGDSTNLIPQRSGDGFVPLHREKTKTSYSPTAISEDDLRFAEARIANQVRLSIYSPTLTSLSNDLFNLDRLEGLDILATSMQTLPGRIGSFSCLTHLRVDGNKISEIEGGVFKAPVLEDVSINRNPITVLPPEISANQRIQSLYLAENSLVSLPEGWEKSSSLTSINVDENQLSALPHSLSLAPKLKRVSARKNRLTGVPEGFGSSHIEELIIAQNQITALPACLAHMSALHGLDVSDNPITGEIQIITDCVRLTSVRLASIGLKNFPDLSRLPLIQLDLSANQISAWPTGPGQLPSTLEELDLRGNQLKEVPLWVETLALRRINLYGNPIPEARQRDLDEKLRKNWEQKQKALKAAKGKTVQ